MDVLWEHGMPHDPALGTRIRAHTLHGQIVQWISTSGTVQFFAAGGMCGLTRTRLHRGRTPHPGDGVPLEAPGLEATSCGCWDATGYASTPPLVVAVADTGADFTAAYDRARTHGTAWLPTPPAGHSDAPCGAHICLATGATSGTAMAEDERAARGGSSP